MELIVESHSNVKDFAEFLSHFIQSASGTALLDKFEGILISIPEDLVITRSEEKNIFPISWATFKGGVLCSSRSLIPTSAVKPDFKWSNLEAYSLNANLSNLFEDEKWELIYNHLGEAAMSKILMKCQLFFPVNSTSYTPLYCEKAERNINKVNSMRQFSKNDIGKRTLDLKPILYGKNLLSAPSSEVKAYSETADICNRIVDDIFELKKGGSNISKSAVTFFKNEVVRKFVQRCSKNKTYNFVLKNIYTKNDASGSSPSKNKVSEKKISNQPKSCSEIRSITIRKRKKRKSLLQEIPLRTVKKTISSHLKNIIPIEMFGKEKFKVIRNLLKVFKYGRNQCFLLDEILDSISIGKVRWVQKCRKTEDKHYFIEKLVKWLIIKWIFPLVSLDYYVTEKQKSSNKIHFYKKSMFKRCLFSTLQKLRRNKILQLLKEKQILDKNYDINRSHSMFRLIPKGNSDLRYVIWDQLKNPLLEELRIFFKQLTSITANSFAPDTKNNLHEYWTNLIDKWNEGGNYPLYFVKADVSDAYGSVILVKLKQIIQKFVKSLLQGVRTLTYRKFKCFNKQQSGLRCYYVWRFEELPPCVPNQSILVPTPDYKEFEVSRLLTVTYLQILMRDLKIGGNTYLMKRGIPHAGKLSSSFCQIYYDQLQKQHLSEFTGNADDIFFRAVDDYLYVTPSLTRAKNFLQKMMRGFKDFGVYINVEKTLTNFGDRPSEEISFYGYMLNTKTMEVYANYHIYSGVKIFYTMSFKNISNPGRFLLERMKSINSLKLHTIILNSKINRKCTMLLGILRAGLLMSFRFKAIVNYLFKTYNTHHLIFCINTCANCISSRVSRLTTPAFGERPVVSAAEAYWIVLAAFILNLPRLPQKSCYYHVVKVLKSQLKTCGLNLSSQQKVFMRNVIKLHNKGNPFKGTH